jgi:hypothetical protein
MMFVPFMVVLNAFASSLPVAVEELATFIARTDPPVTRIRGSRPVPFMPFVMVSYGVPVGVDPHKFRARSGRNYSHNSRWGRRPDSDSNRDLSAKNRHASQQGYC